MTDPLNGSKTARWLDWIVRGVLLVGVLAVGGKLWDHESRLSKTEAQNESIIEDVKEIKKDIKTLLQRR